MVIVNLTKLDYTLKKVFINSKWVVMLAMCPNLVVPIAIMQHVVNVESSGNPYAIGVVNGHLVRQPRNLKEAVATAKMLESKGFNFSVGIAQVNRYNLKPYGLFSYEHAFQVCPNLKVGTQILKECYDRSKHWGKAFSCYYSGNFVTGYKHGYVQKIAASMQRAKLIPIADDSDAIAVISDGKKIARKAQRAKISGIASKKSVSNVNQSRRKYYMGLQNPVDLTAQSNSSPNTNQKKKVAENELRIYTDRAFVF